MSGSKKRVPRPVRSPLVTLAKSTPVGSDEAGLTALCQAIQRRIDAGQMDRPVIVTGDELRAIQSTANMLAEALPHVSCGVWALAAESAADSERKILILMGRKG